MKKVLLILVSALLAASLAGCGGKEPPTSVVSMYDLCAAMEDAAGELSEMRYVSSSDSDPAGLLENVTDFDYEKVEAFFIDYAANGGESADEIVVIAVKDESDVQEVEDSLNAHREKRDSQYAVYCPTECGKLESGLVFSEGRYAVLIVADNAPAIRTAFEDFIGGSN